MHALQIHGDEPVVPAGLGVVDDRAQLGEVAGPQQVLDVPDRFLGQRRQRLGRDLEKRPPGAFDHADPVRGDKPVLGGRVGAERKSFAELEGRGHLRDSCVSGGIP
jgi:hypothetical protein